MFRVLSLNNKTMTKHYIDANTLLAQSFQLAKNIHDSDFTPTALIALWRGGTPIGIAIHEGLSFLGTSTKHFALRTSHYDNNNQRQGSVKIDNFGIIAEQLDENDSLLIVDDVFDSGNTIEALLEKLHRSNDIKSLKEIRIATPYFKPNNNQTKLKPDFYLHETDQWIVFPHELHGLSETEIQQNKPDAQTLFAKPKTI